MKVRDVMIKEVVTVSPHTTYEEAARVLYGNGVSGAPVVDAGGTIVGIISEKDLFRALYPHYEEYMSEPHAYYDQERQEYEIEALRRQPIEKYMTTPAVTVDADAPVLRAGGLLLARGLHRLPVVERGELVGIVTREDIYRKILQNRLFSLHSKVGKNYWTVPPLMTETEIGRVTHYYRRPHVAIIKFDADVPIGTHIRVHGPTTDFEEDIESMEHNHHFIVLAERGQEIGVEVPERARQGDRVYAVG